jgi:hypothetical protein
MEHMSERSLLRRSVATAVLALAWMGASPASAQSTNHQDAAGQGAPYKVPRTVWGHPDLQSVWNFSTPTPLERPAALANVEFLTKEQLEAAAVAAASRDRRQADKVADVREAYNEFWSERGKPTGRTALIVDPSNGRLPPLTAAGARRAAALASELENGERRADSWMDRSLWERCLMRGGLPRIPGSYNNNIQIFQTTDSVVLHYEMIHEARIIPIDGRPHLSARLRQWLGDSRGRWEGDTLVVETTNFTERTSFRGSTQDMKLVERFTRTGPDTIDYRFTVEDPATFTASWTAMLPMNRLDEKMYEYACHEGNEGMKNLLAGARAQENAQKPTAR